jgi:hypothetical protein
LREALTRLGPSQMAGGVTSFNVSGKGDFDLAKLVYFGLSIFWRAAIHGWTTSDGKLGEEVDLGENVEALRLFLLGSGPLPTGKMVLTLDVWAETLVLPALYPVVSEQHDGFERLWFYGSEQEFVEAQ